MSDVQSHPEPTLAEIAAMPGRVLLEFGAGWCGYCRAAQPLIAQALAGQHDLSHLRIEDGKGRRLGRHYRVKLWPTLVLLVDGEEVARLVRPADMAEISAMLAASAP